MLQYNDEDSCHRCSGIHWGGNGSGEFDADVTNDGVVNGLDLAVILDGWGACP